MGALLVSLYPLSWPVLAQAPVAAQQAPPGGMAPEHEASCAGPTGQHLRRRARHARGTSP